MLLSRLANDFVKYRAFKGASPKTGESYELTFGQFVAYLRNHGQDDDVRHFTPEHVEGFSRFLHESGLKASSINVKLAGLSALGKYGTQTKTARGAYVLAENPVLRVERPKKQKPKERYLYRDEMRALLGVDAPACEKLMLALLLDTQLRASAAVNAKVKDLSIDGETVRLSVIEKGDNPDTFALSAHVAELLVESLKLREAGPEEPLLVNAAGRAYTRTSISETIYRLGRKAGITRVPVRAHLFARHSPASLAGQQGASEFEIAAMLRHRDPSTAKRYVHGVTADAVREKVREALR